MAMHAPAAAVSRPCENAVRAAGRELDAQPRGQLAGHAERTTEGVACRRQSRVREPGGRGMGQVSPIHGDADAAEYRHAERVSGG